MDQALLAYRAAYIHATQLLRSYTITPTPRLHQAYETAKLQASQAYAAYRAAHAQAVEAYRTHNEQWQSQVLQM